MHQTYRLPKYLIQKKHSAQRYLAFLLLRVAAIVVLAQLIKLPTYPL